MRTLSLLLAGLPLLAAAQITIQYSDLSPFGVSTNMYVLSDANQLAVLGNGEDQAWSFGTTPITQVGTMVFGAAAGTPYAATYPQSNWTWAQITPLGTDYAYLQITGTQVDIWALSVPSNTNNYTDASKIMQFPLSFGESFSDTYSDNSGPSTINWTYGGNGTLTCSLGTFPNVVKMSSDQDDLLLWNTSPLYPILYYKGSGPVLMFAQNNAGVGETAMRTVSTSPNPCHEAFVVRDATPGARWTIVDAQGRTMDNGQWTNTSGRVDVEKLVPGTYLLVVNDAGTVGRSTFVKE